MKKSGEPSFDSLDALRLVRMFFGPVINDRRRLKEWERIAGTREATTEVVVAHVDNVLKLAEQRRESGPKGKGDALASYVRNAVITAQPLDEMTSFVASSVQLYVQEAFDLGVKAAGGSICDDLGRGLVEVAFSLEEIDAIDTAINTTTSLRDAGGDPEVRKSMTSAWDKLSVHRRRKV